MDRIVAVVLALLPCGFALMLAKRGWQIQLGVLVSLLLLAFGAGAFLDNPWVISPLFVLAALAIIRLQGYDARVSQDKAVARICDDAIRRLEDFRDTLPLVIPQRYTVFEQVEDYQERKEVAAKIVERIHRELRFIDPDAGFLVGDADRFLKQMRMYEDKGQVPTYLHFVHRLDDLRVILDMLRSQAEQRSPLRLYRMFGPHIQRKSPPQS